ncbi:MAG: hypothetical protein AB7P03_30005 [Kofleriaceae bacterium]
MVDTLAWIAVGISLVPAHRAANQTSRALLLALVTVEVVGVVLASIAVASTRTWTEIAQEDGIIEWATFAAFMFAAGWLVLGVRRPSPSRWFTLARLLLAAFCVVVAGEEISWGQRLLGFKPPDVFLELNFQQEANLHNVLMHEEGLGFKIESKHLVIAIAVGFGLLWPLLVRTERFKGFASLAPPLALAPLALGVVAAELSYDVELTGEGAELVTGLLFLASAVVETDRSPRLVVGWLAAPFIAAVVLSTVVTRLMFGSDEQGVRTATAELSILAGDLEAGATDKLLKRSVHKRVFTAVRDGYLRLSGSSYLEGRGTAAEPSALEVRTDRRGYFLDPWNNPYWISYDRREQIGVIYSFGPNRRRDLVRGDPDNATGDDVIAHFELRARDRPSTPTPADHDREPR